MDTTGFVEKLNANRKKIISWILFLAALIFLYKVATIVFLVALALGAALFVNFFGFRWSGLEFTTFAVVIIGMAFGPKTGGIMAFILITLQLLLGQYLDAYVLWVIPGYTVAGVLAGFMGGEIAGVGLTLTIGLHVFFTICTGLFTPARLPKYLPYAGLNIIFNAFLFSAIAPNVLKLLV